MKSRSTNLVVLAAALMAGLLVATGALWLLSSRSASDRTEGEVVAGRPDGFEVGQPVAFAQRGFWLVRLSDDEFLALSWQDPNDNCTVPWRPKFEFLDSAGWFRNPCHAQTYDTEGRCRFGKCAEGLDRFAVRIERGVVIVDTSALTPGPTRRTSDCQPAYPTVCLPPPPFAFTCSPFYEGMAVLSPDPLGLDPDGNGIGCD